MAEALPTPSRSLHRMARAPLTAKLLLALCGLSAATSAWPVAAHAQSIDTTLWATAGPVHAVARSGNTIYIGGQFSHVIPVTGGGAALDVTTAMPAVPFPRVAGQVNEVASDGAGGWYVGGDFTAVGGLARSNIAHVRADGTVSDWNPAANNAIQSLAVSGSTVYVGATSRSSAARPATESPRSAPRPAPPAPGTRTRTTWSTRCS